MATCNQDVEYSEITISGTREELEQLIETGLRKANMDNFTKCGSISLKEYLWEIIDKCEHGTWLNQDVCEEEES